MSESGVEILVRKSYLARVRDAVGTTMFRSLYARVDGEEVDIVKGGDKSCALFVSHVLVGFGLIETVHATVDSTILDMERSGWTRIPHPQEGCVIAWKDDTMRVNGQPRDHLGVYVGKGLAISNSSARGSPKEHDYEIYRVAALFWHPRLDP